MATKPIYSFEDINAVLREIPLPDLAQTVAAEAGGAENYQTLRNQGMTDLDIVGQYVDYPKIPFDLPAMYDVYENDPAQVAREISNYAGVDYDDIRAQQGFSPENLIKFFAEGRELTTGEAAVEGVGRGLTVGLPSAGGALAGAAYLSPLGLPGIITGGLVGGLALGIPAAAVEEEIFPDTPILNPNARATMEGVKTGTEALAFLSQPWAMSRLSRAAFSTDPSGGLFVQRVRQARDTDIIKQFIKKEGRPPNANEIMTLRANYEGSPFGRFLLAAERNPKLFAFIEGSGVLGSGAAAALAERQAPGDMGTRMGAEMLGSFSGQVFMLGPAIKDVVVDSLSRFSKSAAERRAAEGLVRLLELYDENPEEIIKQLSSGQGELARLYGEFQEAYQPDPNVLARLAGVEIEDAAPGLYAPTVGDVTDSFVLRLLEKSIFDKTPGSAPLARQRAQTNIDNLNRLLTMATLSGDAAAISEAAKLREAVFTDMVAARLRVATNNAEMAISKLKVNDKDAGTKASRTIQSLVDNAYDDIRAQENALYEAVNGNFIVPTARTEEAIQNLIDSVPDVLRNKKDYFPQEVLAVLDDLIGASDRSRQVFIADLMASGQDIEMTGAVAKSIGADLNNLALVRPGDVPDVVLEKIPPNLKKRLNTLGEILDEQEGLQDLVARLAPPEDVSGAILSPTSREYRQHFEDLAEEFPDQFASGVQALRQYEAGTQRLRNINREILDNAVTAADVLPIAQSIPDAEPLTADKLNKLRGAFLSAANDANQGEKPNRILARSYGLIQRAILEDFAETEAIRRANLSPDTASQGMLSGAAVIPELAKLEKARAFSVAKGDAFERAFPGQVVRDRATGAPFIEPDLLRQRILSGGGDPTRLRMEQLRNAVGLLAEQGIVEIDAAEAARIAENITSLRDAEDVILRLMVRDQVNEATGDVSQGSIQKQIIQKYGRALDLFPDLKADLQDSVKTQYRLQALELAANDPRSQINEVTALVNDYSTNLIGDNILGALDTALSSSQPSKAVPNLIRHLQQAIPKYETRIGGESTFLPGGVRAVRRGDFEVDDVNRALKAAFFDKAKIYAGGTSGEGINFDQYKKFFFSPGPGQSKPVVRSLIETGVMTQDEASRLNSLLTKAGAIQNKLLDSRQADVVGDLSGAEDVLTDLVLRLTGAEFGATVGRAIPGRGSGQGLIQAQAGSQFARKLLGGIPLGNLREILDNAAKEPKLMAQLLQKGLDRKTLRERRRFATGFAAALRSAGMTGTAEIVEENIRPEPEGQVPAEGQARFPLPDPQNLQRFTQTTPQPSQAPAAPPVAPPVAAAPPPPMPASPTPAQGPQQQMQRQRFAQAYPFDPVSDIIRSQGIGGLI